MCACCTQVSGKVWKAEAEKRASADKNKVLGSSWDKKMQEKALRKAFQEQKAEAVAAQKEKRKVSSSDCCKHQLCTCQLESSMPALLLR